jgi:hypothetical protein
MALGEKDNVPASIAALTAFIKKARISGRTEIDPEGDVGLSLVTPEKYRYDIISKITEDAKKLKAAVGAKCRIELSGLANRVSWQLRCVGTDAVHSLSNTARGMRIATLAAN